MDFTTLLSAATNLPAVITTGTATIEAIDAALPAFEKLFADVDGEAKTAFAAVVTAGKAFIAEIKTLAQNIEGAKTAS